MKIMKKKKRQKEIEKELECKFIRINPDEENFNMSKCNNKIFRHIKKSVKGLTKNEIVDETKIKQNG